MAFTADDYAMTDTDAEMLKGAALLPADLRIEILRRYAADHGRDALVNLFAQFIGLANSVVISNREMIETMLIVDGDMHPHQAERVNLPTVFGALSGVALANGVDQRKTCGGCAYRKGTPANQSPATTADTDWCAGNGDAFMCHERLDGKGRPTKRCAGHAQRVKGRKGVRAG